MLEYIILYVLLVEYNKINKEPSEYDKLVEEYKMRRRNGRIGKDGRIYVFHRRSCKNANESVYKIGKTTQRISQRLKNYERGTERIKHWPVYDCDKMERIILLKLREIYKSRTDYSTEDFEVDRYLLTDTIKEIIQICERD